MKRTMLSFAVSAMLLSGVSAYAATDSANFKVGVLDMHKIMTESPQVEKIKNELQSQFKPKEDKLIKARDALKQDVEKLRKDSAVLSKTDRDNLQQKLMKEQHDLQEQQMAFQQEAVQAQNSAMKVLIDNVRDVSKQIASDRKLNVVITSDSALYFDDSLDITNQVLDKLKKSKS